MTLRLAAAVLAALPLAGCFSFGEDPPPTLMTLTAETPLAVGSARTVGEGNAVIVLPPSVPQTLATLRVPVQASATGVAYLKDAQLTEPPSRLFRGLLAEVVAARTGRPVLEQRQAGLANAARLGGALRSFGLDAQTRAAVVTYDATLARTGGAIQTRRFEARVPVALEDAASLAPALNRAANQVAEEVAAWIGG